MNDDGPPVWDPAFAARLLGAVVLVGITRIRDEGVSQEQFYGTVEYAMSDGITIRLAGTRAGETYRLPPHQPAFHPAQPGTYRLRSTGEEIENPDFVTSWTIEAGENSRAGA